MQSGRSHCGATAHRRQCANAAGTIEHETRFKEIGRCVTARSVDADPKSIRLGVAAERYRRGAAIAFNQRTKLIATGRSSSVVAAPRCMDRTVRSDQGARDRGQMRQEVVYRPTGQVFCHMRKVRVVETTAGCKGGYGEHDLGVQDFAEFPAADKLSN